MSVDIESFLAEVRDAEGPSADDQRRVLGVLRASIAAGVVSSVAVKASALEAVAGKSALGASLSAVTTKLSVVAVTGALAIGAGYRVLSRSAPLQTSPSAQKEELQRPNAPLPGDRRAGKGRSQSPRAQGETSSAALAPEAPSREKKIARSRPGSSGTSASALRNRPESLEAELELLQEVQSDLRRGAPREALAKLDAHRTEDRQLLAERSAARILALCAIGRVDEARRRAAAFLKQHPRSVQRTAVVESCANPRRVQKP